MRYRDMRTGRFAKKTTYRRSIAQGGRRYRAEVVKRPPPPVPLEIPEAEPSFTGPFVDEGYQAEERAY